MYVTLTGSVNYRPSDDAAARSSPARRDVPHCRDGHQSPVLLYGAVAQCTSQGIALHCRKLPPPRNVLSRMHLAPPGQLYTQYNYN